MTIKINSVLIQLCMPGQKNSTFSEVNIRDLSIFLILKSIFPANRKRYHNVSIWLCVGLVATQHRLNLTMTFAMSCRKVMLKPTIGKSGCYV